MASFLKFSKIIGKLKEFDKYINLLATVEDNSILYIYSVKSAHV